MAPSADEPVTIEVDETTQVSGLLQRPSHARACLVLAHGAGAGMRHPFMSATARELDALGMATLRYQFPYMEKRSKRPDPPPRCHATVRAAVAKAASRLPGLPLLAGGKSFGGRMTSQAQALAPLSGVQGLVFLGFPLHPPGKPSTERAEHLLAIDIPMLFLQGARDEFASLELLEPLIIRLGSRATLQVVAEADHSFHVPARSGRKDAEVRGEMWQSLIAWMRSISKQ